MLLLVAGVASGAMAIGASTTATSYRRRSFTDQARLDAQQDLALWSPESPPELLIRRLDAYEAPGGPGIVVITDGGRVASSAEQLSEDDLPNGMRLRTQGAGGALIAGGTRVAGAPYLVIGQLLDPQSAEVYSFYSKAELLQGLEQLRVTLFASWLLVTGGAAVAGHVIARRALLPLLREPTGVPASGRTRTRVARR